MPFNANPERRDYAHFLASLLSVFPKGIAVVVANKNVGFEVEQFAKKAGAPVLCKLAYNTQTQIQTSEELTVVPNMTKTQIGNGLTHLQQLEAQSIQILREVAAESDNPVMLYSVGKDSAVMLHLARKAFFPAKPPLPLLHIDTTWKFQETMTFRDKVVKEFEFDLITHTNAEGVKKAVNPFTHGSALHIDIMKTEALTRAGMKNLRAPKNAYFHRAQQSTAGNQSNSARK